MELRNGLLMVISAIVLAVPVVVWVPRARQSAVFDRLLWAGTVLMGILGAGLVLEWTGTHANAPIGTRLVPIVLGSLGGALVLNLLLWVMDRGMPPEIMESDKGDDEHADKDKSH